MADKLIIVMANTNPDIGAEAAAPFVQAAIAAAMGYEVEILFTGRSGKLAQRGIAENLQTNLSKSVRDLIQEAHDSGVTFKLCPPTVDINDDDLIAEIDDTVGAAYLISESMNDDTVTFTY